MPTTKEIDVAKFEKLLNWLDSDRDLAGQKYESIRRRLIWVLQSRGCLIPEELADEAIDRVIQKIETVTDGYRGNPNLYFYSVARNLLHEYFRRPQLEELSEFTPQPETDDRESERNDCLAVCLQTLTDEQRQLFISYHQTDRPNHIKQRKLLALSLNISEGNLRRKICRIKNTLQKCVLNCLEKKKV